MLGKYIRVKVVKPIGSTDENGYTFPLNYGTVQNDESQEAFIMGIHHPVSNFDGRVIAVMTNKTKTILILAPKSTRFIINDIKEYIDFEKDFPDYKVECLYESSCGAVIFRDIKGEIRFLLIKNKRSAHWGFPKGHIEMNESKIDTALREVLEETGLHIKIYDGFECQSKYKIQNKIEKNVSIFVGSTNDSTTIIQKEEIEDYIWLTYERAQSLLKYDNDKKILESAYSYLNEKNII